MSEDRTDSLNEQSTNPTPIEQRVEKQLELILTRLDNLESSLRAEMVKRFVQVSRQVRDLDWKVDVFIKEQLYLKQDLREVRDSLTPKN